MKVKAYCLECGQVGSVCMDLDGSGLFRCLNCEKEFTADAVRELIAGAKTWAKILAWAEQYPTDEPQS